MVPPRLRSVLAVVSLAAWALAVPAHAAFPGANGKINFDSSRSPPGHYFMNPDGSASAQAPASGVWSPDASRVLFQCSGGYYCVFRADGTYDTENAFGGNIHGLNWSPDGNDIIAGTQLCGADFCDPAKVQYTGYPSGPGGTVTSQDDFAPAWSPDGTKVAFVTYRNDPVNKRNSELYVSNVDGTGQVRLTNGPGSEGMYQEDVDDDVQSLPSWSPDGTKIAFASTRDDPNPATCSPCRSEIYVVKPDGTGLQRLTNTGGQNVKPVWSPDGTKIAFQTNRDGNQEIYSMNPDGSGQTNLTNNPADDILYDWLSIPQTYARPKGATPLKTYLVPAYKPCTAPNRTHGAPLAFPSCAPPQQASDWLTVGTADSNGQPTKSVGSVRYDAFSCPACVGPGPNADVRIAVSITDVRNKSDLSDYTGELRLDQALRITDKNNTPNPGGPGPATVSDTSFPTTVPCATTSDTTVGSTCSVMTSANTLVPNAVVAGERAIWEFGQVQIYDGGADGVASTTGDNTLFMDQGVFIP
jgi:WD40-like Beta Propeller Repeat